MHDPSAFDFEGVGGVRLGELERHVAGGLLLDARKDLATRHEVAFLAGERRVVDVEHHRDGGLVHGDRGERLHVVGVAQRVADAQFLDARDDGDIAAHHFFGGDAVEAFVAEELLGRDHERLLAVRVGERVALADAERAALDATDGDTAEEVVVVEGRRLEAHGGVRRRLLRGHLF